MKKEMEEIKERLSDDVLNTRIGSRIDTIIAGKKTYQANDLETHKIVDEKTLVHKSIKEIEQRKSRRPNMVIFQYPEDKSNLRAERKKHDLKLIHNKTITGSFQGRTNQKRTIWTTSST